MLWTSYMVILCSKGLLPGMKLWFDECLHLTMLRLLFGNPDSATQDSANYSVRSDYLWLQRPEHVTEQHLKTWLVLSQLNALLPKIRIFRWCIAHEALPVVSRLQAAGHTLGLCHQAEAETILHALWDCPCTHEALDMAGLLSGISQSQLSLTLKWLGEAILILDIDVFAEVATILVALQAFIEANRLVKVGLLVEFDSDFGPYWDHKLSSSVMKPMIVFQRD
ncbi:hypothetical protein V6N13_021990 [Hibiscus sabdariffa]